MASFDVFGSAHPKMDDDGCLINFHGSVGAKHTTNLYKLCPDEPFTRKIVQRYDDEYVPYLHSWGLTKDYAIFLHQHFELQVQRILEFGGTLQTAFVGRDEGGNTKVMVLPLDGSDALEFQVDGEIFYDHEINSYQDGDKLYMDFIGFGTDIFKNIATLQQFRNKTYRDAMPLPNRGRYQRMVLDMTTKTGHVETIFNEVMMLDFPKVNPTYARKKYCIYYCVEWFHNPKVFGAMAIMKHNICDGTRLFYHIPNQYPSEPTFVDDPDSDQEDGGVLLLSMFDGKSSSMVVVDATTMKEVSRQEVSSPFGFTTHGQFYPKKSG